MIANIFGKIFAKQQKLTAQAKVSRINREIAKITKNISRAERQANQQKRAATNSIKQQFSIFTNSNIQAQVMAQAKTDPNLKDLFNADGTMNYSNQALWQQFNQEVANQKMIAQNQLQAQLDQIEEEYEQFQEITLQALKDEQADLEAEKATAEAQIQLYEGIEKQEAEFAKSNIQGMFG